MSDLVDPRIHPHVVPWFFKLMSMFQRPAHPVAWDVDPDALTTDLGPDAFSESLKLTTDRRRRMEIFEEMDTFGLVSSILEIFAEESTQPDYDKGRRVWVESSNVELIKAANGVFDNCMVEERIPAVSRRLYKFGDSFQRLVYQTGKGVLGWRNATPKDVNRWEDKHGRLIGFSEKNNAGKSKKFRGKDREESWPWDYIHFRILGRDESELYGTSHLQAMFRPWRQLCILGSTRIWTTEGPVAAEDVEPGMEVYCHDPATKVTVETRVATVSKMGEQPLVRIRTPHRQITVTGNHRMLVQTVQGNFEYKEAKDLIPNGGVGRLNWHGYKNADKLVLPALTCGTRKHVVRIDPSTYSIRLTEPACYEAEGVMERIRSCDLATTDKNAHAFLSGLRSIRWDDYVKLLDAFQLPVAVPYSYKSKHPAPFGSDFTFVADSRFLRFFGFMLGDGWLAKNRVGIAPGVDDAQNERYIALMRELFPGIATTQTEPIEGTRGGVVEFNSHAVVDVFLAAGFVTGFANKVIPGWVFGLHPTLKRELIYGLLDADGGRHSNSNGWKLQLSNKLLVEQAVTLCQQTGFRVSREIGEDLREGRKPAYRVFISEGPHDDLVVYENVTHVDDAGYGDTYDLGVEDDLHNFVADGVVSHNSLAEDATLSFRLRRAPDRNVIYFDRAGLDSVEAARQLNVMRKRFRKHEYVDPASPDYKKQFNPMNPMEDIFLPTRDGDNTRVETLAGSGSVGEVYDMEHFRDAFFGSARVPKCLRGDTEIPLLNGAVATIRELAENHADRKFWVYSRDADYNVVAGLAHSPRVTGYVDRLVRVTLDNGEVVESTPEHRFMRSDGSYVEAQALRDGDSLSPWYCNPAGLKDKLPGYLKIQSGVECYFKYVHRVVACSVYGLIPKGWVVHHVDFDKLNNDPGNLWVIPFDEHIKLHKALGNNGSVILRALWDDPVWAAAHKARLSVAAKAMQARRRIDDPEFYRRFSDAGNGALRAAKARGEDVYDREMKSRVMSRNNQKEAFSRARLDALREATTLYGVTVDAVREIVAANEGIRLSDVASLLDCSPVTVSRRLRDAGVTFSAITKAAWGSSNRESATFGRNHKVARIDLIELASPEPVYDLEVDKHHNFAVSSGVFIHNSYFGFEGDINAKATLMQQDVRFARSVKRGQTSLLRGLRSLVDTHLVLLETPGEGDKYGTDYLVKMSPISYLDEFERLELMRLRFEIVQQMNTMAAEMQIDARVWAIYLLTNFAKLPEEVVLKLVKKTPEEAPLVGGEPAVAAGGGEEFEALSPEQKEQILDTKHKAWLGTTNFTLAEAQAAAQAVHKSPGLRRSLGIFAEYHSDDHQDAMLYEQQVDRTLLPPVGIDVKDSFEEDDKAKQLAEDWEEAEKAAADKLAEQKRQALEEEQ